MNETPNTDTTSDYTEPVCECCGSDEGVFEDGLCYDCRDAKEDWDWASSDF